MTYHLVLGCPRHHEGHDRIVVGLPVRLDAFERYLRKLRCATPVKGPGEEHTCGQAVMLIGVEPCP